MALERIHCELDPHELVPLDECVACAESANPARGRCQFTGAILRAMYANSEERRDAGVSATGLVGCLRQTALRLIAPYNDRPNRMWPALRGNLFHLLPERYHAPHLICEVRFKKVYDEDGHFITGKMDEVDPARGTLVDYKSVHTFPERQDLRLSGRKESWVLQTNIYRWLLQGGTRLDSGDEVQIPIQTIGVLAFGMMGVRKYRVPILPDADVAAFVRDNAAQVQLALDGGPWPARKYDPQRDKLCLEWCPVRDACVTRP